MNVPNGQTLQKNLLAIEFKTIITTGIMNTIKNGIEILFKISGKNNRTIKEITATRKTPKNIQLNKSINFMNLESRFSLGKWSFSVNLKRRSWKKPSGHKNPQKILPNKTQKIAATDAKEMIIGIRTDLRLSFVGFRIAKTQQTIKPTFSTKPMFIPKILNVKYFLCDMNNIIKICIK